MCFWIPGAQVLGHRAGTFPGIFLTEGGLTVAPLLVAVPLLVGPSISPLGLCAEVSSILVSWPYKNCGTNRIES